MPWIYGYVAKTCKPHANCLRSDLAFEGLLLAVMGGSKAEVLAQVKSAGVGTVDDLVRASLDEDLTRMDDSGSVNETQGLANVVIGD